MTRRTTERIDLETATKIALSDDEAWSAFTSSYDGCHSMQSQLRQMLAIHRGERDRQKSLVGAANASYSLGTMTKADYHECMASYNEWRTRAARFEALVQRRLGELKEILGKWRNSEDKQILVSYREAVDALVRAVFLHEAKEINDDELHETLDATKLIFNTHGEMSIRQAVLRGFVAEEELRGHRHDVLMERISVEVPASAQHRGVKSFSPVPRSARS